MVSRSCVLIFAVMLVCISVAQCSSTSQDNSENVLTVGALLSLHGDSDNHGISAQVALKTAETDINKLFSDLGRPFRVSVVVEDTNTDTESTQNALNVLQARGIRIMVGPEESQSLADVREYANRNGIILISGASTAPSLAIGNDNVFRLAPDDATLAHLLAAMMQNDGIRVLVPLARRDLWADGMLNSTKSEFERGDGIMLDGVRYDPHTTNFSSDLDLLRSEVRRAVKGNGANYVAVHVSAFDEIVAIFSQASGDPVLSSVRWYGNDLSAVAISQNRTAAQFAESTHFLSPVFGGMGGAKYLQIKNAVFNETGREASPFAANDYDALWLITYTYLLAGCDDAEAFKLAFPIVAGKYRGEFGWMKLNLAGDLIDVPFTIAHLTRDNDTFKWEPYAIL